MHEPTLACAWSSQLLGRHVAEGLPARNKIRHACPGRRVMRDVAGLSTPQPATPRRRNLRIGQQVTRRSAGAAVETSFWSARRLPQASGRRQLALPAPRRYVLDAATEPDPHGRARRQALDDRRVFRLGRQHRRYELIDGAPVALAPPTHGTIVIKLGNALGAQLRPCRVVGEAGIVLPDGDDAWYQAALAITCTRPIPAAPPSPNRC